MDKVLSNEEIQAAMDLGLGYLNNVRLKEKFLFNENQLEGDYKIFINDTSRRLFHRNMWSKIYNLIL